MYQPNSKRSNYANQLQNYCNSQQNESNHKQRDKVKSKTFCCSVFCTFPLTIPLIYLNLPLNIWSGGLRVESKVTERTSISWHMVAIFRIAALWSFHLFNNPQLTSGFHFIWCLHVFHYTQKCITCFLL